MWKWLHSWYFPTSFFVRPLIKFRWWFLCWCGMWAGTNFEHQIHTLFKHYSRTIFEQKFIMCSNFVLLLFKLCSNNVQIQTLFTLCSSFWGKIWTLFPFCSTVVQIFWRPYWRGKVCSIFVHGRGQSLSSKGLHSSIIQTVFISKLYSNFVHTLFKFKLC